MKTTNTAPARTQSEQKAALSRLSSVTAPRPSPAPFCYIACTFSAASGEIPLRELPARFSFDAATEESAREVVAAVLALGYTVKSALYVNAARGFVPLVLADPEPVTEKAPKNRVRLIMGHSAPLYTRADTGQAVDTKEFIKQTCAA